MPQAEISWVVERRSSEILRDNPLLDRLIEVDTKALRRGLMSGETLRAPRQQLRRLRASAFDVALDFQGLLKSASIARLSGARRVFGYSRAGLREPASAFSCPKRVAVPKKRPRNPQSHCCCFRGLWAFHVPEELSFPINITPTDEAEARQAAADAGGNVCDSESGRWLADQTLERGSIWKTGGSAVVQLRDYIAGDLRSG